MNFKVISFYRYTEIEQPEISSVDSVLTQIVEDSKKFVYQKLLTGPQNLSLVANTKISVHREREAQL